MVYDKLYHNHEIPLQQLNSVDLKHVIIATVIGCITWILDYVSAID